MHKHAEELDWIKKSCQNLKFFEPLYAKYYENVYLFIHRRCMNTEDCLDLCSKVFEKAMLNISKYQYKGFAFSTWLYRISQNTLSDYFRNQQKDKKLWVHDDGLLDISSDLEYDSSKEEYFEILQSELVKLSDENRNLVTMRYFEKMSYEDIAEIHDTNVNQLRVKLHRIIKGIRKSIERKNLND